MAYDEGLAERIREELSGIGGVVEKRMFGGLGFIVQGNMACGVHGQEMIVRVGPVEHPKALKKAHVRVFDMSGKPMAGWLMVEPEGIASDKDLAHWVKLGTQYALSLPAKG